MSTTSSRASNESKSFPTQNANVQGKPAQQKKPASDPWWFGKFARVHMPAIAVNHHKNIRQYRLIELRHYVEQDAHRSPQ